MPAGTKSKPPTTSAWGARVWHDVTLPSGMVVQLRIPGLTELVKANGVPDHLRALALASAANPNGVRGEIAKAIGDTEAETVEREKATRQAIDDLADMTKHLILACVREPVVTAEELDTPGLIPEPDKELLGAIMLRETSYDAKGVKLGVEPLDIWERFRHHHECPADCESCTTLQDEFSTADLGDL